MDKQLKSDEFFRSILKDGTYQKYLKARPLFRFVVIVLPMLTGFLAIVLGPWAARHGGDTWTALTDLAIKFPRAVYGVAQLAINADYQYRKDILGIYTLFMSLSVFWFIFSLALGLWMHLRFHRSGGYQFKTYYQNFRLIVVGGSFAVAVLIYHMIFGLRFFPYPENPSRFRMPPNRFVFIFESVCLSGLSMFLIGLVVALGFMYSRWCQSKRASFRSPE